MSTADEYLLGRIVQYVGATDANYTHGWFYECVSDGEEPPTYSWQALMDSVPTSGSKNPVTSDGIYQVTPFTRGTGLWTNSAHLGAYSSSTNRYSIAVGYYASASGESSAALGNLIRANQKSMLSCGTCNNPRTGDLFNIGNGTSNNNRSNIVEVNRTEMNVNGDIKRNGVSIYPLVYDSTTESFLFGGVSS